MDQLTIARQRHVRRRIRPGHVRADKSYPSKPISGHMRLCGISVRSKQRNTVKRAVSRLRRRRPVLP